MTFQVLDALELGYFEKREGLELLADLGGNND